MSERDYLSAVANDTQLMLLCLEQQPAAPVPTCPGWDVARLVGHTSRVHRMATAIVSRGMMDRPSAADTIAPPEDVSRLAQYVHVGLTDLIRTLTETPADRPAWNMAGQPPTASFWHRRMAHETAVHRVDAQLAAGESVHPIDPLHAIDGVDEFLTLFQARVLPQHPDASIGGSLHLHATDGPGEWMITLEGGALKVDHGHGKGDAAIRGAAADLFLALWGRAQWNSPFFEYFGNRAVADSFTSLGAF
jgi:uncharacterized protein (TIGR03083 family)